MQTQVVSASDMLLIWKWGYQQKTVVKSYLSCCCSPSFSRCHSWSSTRINGISLLVSVFVIIVVSFLLVIVVVLCRLVNAVAALGIKQLFNSSLANSTVRSAIVSVQYPSDGFVITS